MRSLLSILILVLASTPAQADLIDMGHYTRDTETGLDWLDVTPTLRLTYNDVVNESSTWSIAGWRHATVDEACILIQQHFYPPFLCNSGVTGSDVSDAVEAYQGLFGVEAASNGHMFTIGMLKDPVGGSLTVPISGAAIRSSPSIAAGTIVTAAWYHPVGVDVSDPFRGHHLVRPNGCSGGGPGPCPEGPDFVVNINAPINGTPNGSGSIPDCNEGPHQTQERLVVAGTYDVTLVDPSGHPEATQTAWRHNAQPNSWRTDWQLSFEDDSIATGGSSVVYDSAAEAFANSPKSVQIVVPTDQVLRFYVPDTIICDNDGGVSLRVTQAAAPVPSISSWGLWTLCGILVGIAVSLRRIRVQF